MVFGAAGAAQKPKPIGPEIVDFGVSNDPSLAPILPSKKEGGDVPHLSGWVGKSTGPIGPNNLTHQTFLHTVVGLEVAWSLTWLYCGREF